MADSFSIEAVVRASADQFSEEMSQLGALTQSTFEGISDAITSNTTRGNAAMEEAAGHTRNWGEALEQFATTAAGVAGGLALVDLAEKAGEAFREAIRGDHRHGGMGRTASEHRRQHRYDN
jgi:hypothetical protein